jgi:hypothetical protein
MPVHSPRSSPSWIAYGIPAGLLAVVVFALSHPLLGFLAGLAAAVGAAVRLAPPLHRFLDGPAAPTAFIGS